MGHLAGLSFPDFATLNPGYRLAVFLIGDLHQRENATTHLRGFYAQEGFEQREVLDGGGKGGQ